jgi:hypothetical protein
MSLKGSIERTLRAGRLPVPPEKVRTKTEKAAAGLGTAIHGASADRLVDKSWDAIGARMNFGDFDINSHRDIRSAIANIWQDESRRKYAGPLVQYGLESRRKSFDREIVLAYLRRFPLADAAFPVLAAAAGGAAERHDWPWRQRGRDWLLWNAQQRPAKLGDALMRTDQPLAVLRGAGLDGDLEAGAFVANVLDTACLKTAESRGPEAEQWGKRLVLLFESLQVGGSNALLAYGLLSPWGGGNPGEAYRKSIAKLLVDRIGDPRFNTNAWEAVADDLRRRKVDFDPAQLVAVLRRWLTQETVRAFFRIVGATTDRKDQWDAREAFWLGYLKAGLIQDAWFAFGRRAEAIAGARAADEGLRFGRVVGGGDPSHSALLIALGDLRIAEWSHNGACRFWPAVSSTQATKALSSASAPQLYLATYEGPLLRATFGPSGFA